MIHIFPNDSETFVVPEPPVDVLLKISNELQRPFRGLTGDTLTGWIEGSEFVLTIQLRRHQIFMPVINGSVEQTSKGSIVFMKYKLFPGTRMLLLFWTWILPVVGGFIAYQYQNYLILAGALLFLAFTYGIAWANFKLHVKTTKKIVYRILN